MHVSENNAQEEYAQFVTNTSASLQAGKDAISEKEYITISIVRTSKQQSFEDCQFVQKTNKHNENMNPGATLDSYKARAA